jgi:hypothetical protein
LQGTRCLLRSFRTLSGLLQSQLLPSHLGSRLRA